MWSLALWTAWIAAASAAWLLLVNRWAMRIPDSRRKSLIIVGSWILLVAAAALSARRAAPPFIPVGVLALAALGEIRRWVLRHRTRARPAIGSTPRRLPAWHPVTTLDLVAWRHEVLEPSLPLDRLRIAQISDLHVDPCLPLEHYVSAFDLASSHRPDLLLLCGDYVTRAECLPLLADVLRGRLSAPYGCFAVLGNHDHWTGPDAIRRILTEAGACVLAGHGQRIELPGGRALRVCGTEYPWGPDLTATLPDSDLTIVLSHTPDNIYRLARRGANAVFSGHFHGGQLRLPLVGALVIPSLYGRRFDRGRFQVNGTHLFVSSGVGAADPPLRLYCRPDVMIVDLVQGGVSHAPPPDTRSGSPRPLA